MQHLGGRRSNADHEVPYVTSPCTTAMPCTSLPLALAMRLTERAATTWSRHDHDVADGRLARSSARIRSDFELSQIVAHGRHAVVPLSVPFSCRTRAWQPSRAAAPLSPRDCCQKARTAGSSVALITAAGLLSQFAARGSSAIAFSGGSDIYPLQASDN